MSIEIKGKVYRNLQEQVEKNKEDIQGITGDIQSIKSKTITIYTHLLTSDIDRNQPIQFSGTITLIGNVVIAVNGVVIIQDTNKYPVVAFDQINEVENTITITGTGNSNSVTIDVGDFDAMDTYPLY